MLPASPPPQFATFVRGRYLVRITHIALTGEARGRVVRATATPGDDEMLAVYSTPDRVPPPAEELGCIGALPGELVEIELRWRLPRPERKRARHTPPPTSHLVRVIEPAAERVAPPCPVFGECGGCQLQHMPYPSQLAWKTQRVAATLRAAGFADPPVLPMLGAGDPWHYRNHMRFSVNREGQSGLTARGTRRVLPLVNCPIADEHINAALATLANDALPQPQVLLRYGTATGQIVLQPAPTDEQRRRVENLGIEVHDDAIEEEIAGARFRIRPSSFFQTNSAQANEMARLVRQALPSGRAVTLVDAYCGVGTFARLLAPGAGRVLAIEESASAIRDARYNLRDVANVEIVQAKVEDILPDITERLDGLVIDPPRAGCQRPVLDALVARRVPHVVYVSCDPDTLARDLAYLCLQTGAYRVRSVQPLDMFPQTAHIENVVALEAMA